MTVKGLIEELQKMPQDARVQMEGSEWASDIDRIQYIKKGQQNDDAAPFNEYFIQPDNSKEDIVYLR